MLDEYLVMMEAKRHRKLGGTSVCSPSRSAWARGLPLWLPKGAALRDRLEQFCATCRKNGYQRSAPHIGNKELTSPRATTKYGKDVPAHPARIEARISCKVQSETAAHAMFVQGAPAMHPPNGTITLRAVGPSTD